MPIPEPHAGIADFNTAATANPVPELKQRGIIIRSAAWAGNCHTKLLTGLFYQDCLDEQLAAIGFDLFKNNVNNRWSSRSGWDA